MEAAAEDRLAAGHLAVSTSRDGLPRLCPEGGAEDALASGAFCQPFHVLSSDRGRVPAHLQVRNNPLR